MNLYRPDPLLDSPFAPPDLEWLYRSQDIDGASLSSRLADLAPVSFTNTIDGQRRRRLFAVESWESNQFDWANDNPRTRSRSTASIRADGQCQLRHGDAPRSASRGGSRPGPPRPKDQPQLPPAGLERPRRANPAEVDLRHVPAPQVGPAPPVGRTPEELAQLSQFVINIIDFRDPDCTMTHWQNPDVLSRAGTARDGPHAGPGLFQRPTASRWTSTAWSTTRWPSTRCSHSPMRTPRGAARRPTGSLSSWSTR